MKQERENNKQRKQILESISEAKLRDKFVIPLAKVKGWAIYFTWNSFHSPAGLIDLILLRDKVLWRELKSERGKLTESQKQCINLLSKAGQDVKVWYPRDWDSGLIEKELE